jgi:hypothetical protein
MRLGRFLIGAAVLAPSIAVAEAGQANLYDVVVGPSSEDGYQSGRQVLPAGGDDTAGALAASRTVFLNKNGITLSPGVNDARINRSTVVTQATMIPAWNVSASVWADTVSCIREVFSPFDITVVDADPGNVPHIEAVFGGTPAQLGLSAQLSGVSPFTTDCAVIENSIVFTFMGSLPADARLACQIQAQEIAHSFGLDHVLLAPDLMTYLPYAGRRWFQNQAAQCGEDKARPCGLNGSACRQSQNSVALLIERVGLRGVAGDTVAPTVGITSPRDGETVPPMFDVDFTATDNAKVLMASLYIDGTPSGSVVAAPLSITMPRSLTAGTHKLRIVATDGNNEKAQEITVTVDENAEDDVMGGCAAGGGGGGGAAEAALSVALAALARRRRGR